MQCVSQLRGNEIYTEIHAPSGEPVILTYNDLWLMIVCREVLNSDWERLARVAKMMPDPSGKYTLVKRLERLERELHGLPEIPQEIVEMHLRPAHIWFNRQPVYVNSNQQNHNSLESTPPESTSS